MQAKRNIFLYSTLFLSFILVISGQKETCLEKPYCEKDGILYAYKKLTKNGQECYECLFNISCDYPVNMYRNCLQDKSCSIQEVLMEPVNDKYYCSSCICD